MLFYIEQKYMSLGIWYMLEQEVVSILPMEEFLDLNLIYNNNSTFDPEYLPSRGKLCFNVSKIINLHLGKSSIKKWLNMEIFPNMGGGFRPFPTT